MDLEINNKIDNKTTDNEVTDFINDLNDALEKKQELNTNGNLFNEILQDVELASKYKSKLQSTINKCLKDMSYERDFFYFDYDKRNQNYFLDYYSDGKKERINLTKKEIQNYKENNITFYGPIESENDYITMVEADSLKDWMKCEVGSALLDIDIESRKSKGNK